MMSALLFDKTPPEVRLDAPIDATIHIPLNLARALLRVLSLAVMAGGALFALVSVAVHFNDPTFLAKIGQADTLAGQSVTVVRVLQILIAAVTLLFAVFAALRLFLLMQSRESGLDIGPRGLTVACDLRSANTTRIAWRSIAAIEHTKTQGLPAVVVRLRPPDDAARDYPRFKFWPGSRVMIPLRALRVGQADVKMLLDRYFARYAVPPSKETP